MTETTSTRLDGTGMPSDEEMAAIIAAVEFSSPAPGPSVEAQEEVLRWRFSGRWWSKPVPVRRDRPF